MPKELTQIQKNILEYIIKIKLEKGFPPTLADVAKQFGYSARATVQQHFKALEEKGFIKKTPKLSRGIELTLEEKFFLTKPIIGEVAAGNPLTIYPDAIDSVELPTIVRMPRESFLLRVKGDSLKDAYIFNKDVVIVNPNLEPRNGQFVVAILNDAAVVKKFYKKKNEIELVSENPEFKPIVISKNYSAFKIVGIVVGVYRSLEKRVG